MKLKRKKASNSMHKVGMIRILALLITVAISLPSLFGQKNPTTAKMDYTLTPTYGSITLSSISPSMHSVEIISGGSVNASYQGGSCSGWVSEAPDYRFHWDGSTTQLIFLFTADETGADPTILVNAPDGTWHCNDDVESGNLNPGIAINSPATGQYDIWVGSYEDGKYIEGSLYVADGTNINTNGASKTTTAKLNYELEPHFSSFRLSAGFSPDPYTISGKSGGSIDVSAMGIGSNCTGYAAEAPDFRLNWTGSTSDLRIMFQADNSGEDAVLIINTPGGDWLCNDDATSSTLNPMLLLNGESEGQFDIWVASLSSGAYIDGKLIVTERNQTP